MNIDKIFWHDGVIGEVLVAPKDRSADGFTFTMHASLYPTPQDRLRQQYKSRSLAAVCYLFAAISMSSGKTEVLVIFLTHTSKSNRTVRCFGFTLQTAISPSGSNP
jgi:hypothetical protein